MDIQYYLVLIATFSFMAASPGPANLALSTLAMKAGRRSALSFGAGLTLGLWFWGVVAAVGLGAVLQTSIYAQLTLKFLAGIYFLWMAYHTGRAAMRPKLDDQPQIATRKLFLSGILMNLLNPKVILAWMAVLSLTSGSSLSFSSLWSGTLICFAIAALNYAGYACLFSTGIIRRGYAKIERAFETCTAFVFTITGVGFLRSIFAR